MRRVWHLWHLILVLLALLGSAPSVHAADGPVPIVFLPIESDDAEDQASALTAAIRAKIRAGNLFTLSDTNQTLGMLTAGLRCGTRPEAACARKIGDQLKSERYIWGVMQKSGPKDVVVDLHLVQRGKDEVVAKETFPFVIKDPTDPQLKKVASRLFDTLSGRKVGTINVYAGDVNGTVLVDGKESTPMKKGVASLELSPGEHSFQVSAPGRQTTSQNAFVIAGKEASLTISLPVLADATSDGPKKPFPVRKAVAWSAIGVGALFEVIAAAEFGAYFGHLSDGNSSRDAYGALRPRAGLKCTDGVANPEAIATSSYHAETICAQDKLARDTSTAGWIFGGIGVAAIGTGIYLLVTEKTEPEKSEKKTMRLSPTFGPQGGSLSLSGSF